jgi:hypothetical protein
LPENALPEYPEIEPIPQYSKFWSVKNADLNIFQKTVTNVILFSLIISEFLVVTE